MRYFDGEKLKELRKNRGLTTSDIAEQVNVSQSYISRFENNRAIPDVEMLGKILAALDSNLTSFFYNEGDSNIDLQELEGILEKLDDEKRTALINFLKVWVSSS